MSISNYYFVLFAALMVGLSPVAHAQRIELKALPDEQWEKIETTVPEVALAQPATQPPTIDGQLTDAVWQQAPVLKQFPRTGGVPEGANKWVMVGFAFDDQNLYIGGKLAKPGKELRAEVKQNGGRVWTDDALELFFYDNTSQSRYQLVANSAGAYWTGGSGAAASWKPELKVATQVLPDAWQIEIAIPRATLPPLANKATLVPMQARYLVNNQSGYVAWVDADEKSSGGALAFSPDASPQQMVQLKSIYFPGQVPQGEAQVGVEAYNPSDQPRKFGVRLMRTEDQWNNSNYAEIKPHATQKLFVTLQATEQPKPYTLLFRDMANANWTFSREKRIATLPEIDLQPLRGRVWFGEPKFEAQLNLGLPEQQRTGTTIQATLFSPTTQLEQTKALPLQSPHNAVAVDLKGLQPGAYKLQIALQAPTGAHTLTHEFNIEQATPLPQRKQVALQLNWPQSTLVQTAPVYCGLAMPGGMLTDAQQVRLVDDRGQEVPLQTEVLARWSPAGSIKWLGLYFTAERSRKYSAEFGSAVKRTAPTGASVKVTDGADAITVDTGAARFEIPKSGALLGKAWLGTRQILAGGQPCLLVTDQKGRTASEAAGGGEPVVEVSGPQRVIIRREGAYRTANGERLGAYVVRLAFSAGSPLVHLQHSFIVTENSNDVQYSDLAVRLSPAFAGPWQAALATSPDASAKPYSAQFDPKSQATLSLAQLDYPHFRKTDSLFKLSGGTAADNKTLEQGKVAGNWAAVSGTEGGVTIAVQHMAKMFPKEVSISGDGLAAHLWSNKGGRLLDYRPASLIDYWGQDWAATYPAGGLEGVKKIEANAAGTARTHELIFALTAPEAAQQTGAQIGVLAEQPVLAIQDPQWLRETDALGPLQPYDPKQFPRIEAFNRSFFRDDIVGQAERAGDFGFLDYGNGPHTYTNTQVLPGQDKPRFGYRYSNMDYQGRTAFWLDYARSGDRMYYDYADALNRNLYDFHFSYFDQPKRKLGAMLGGEVSEGTPLYWSGWSGWDGIGMFIIHQGWDLANFLDEYYLTGDRRAMDGPLLFEKRLIADFDPLVLPDIGATSNNAFALGLTAQLYGYTWDERLGNILRVARPRLLDLDTTTGLVDEAYYGATYKWDVRHYATLEDYKVTGASLSKAALIKGVSLLLDEVPQASLGYQDHTGQYAAYAYRWTGDDHYVRWIAQRLGRTAETFSDDKGNILPGAYMGTHSSTFPETVAYGLDLLSQNETRKDYPLINLEPALTGAQIYFSKKEREPLHFRIGTRGDWDLQIATLANPKLKERRDYFVGTVKIESDRNYFTYAAEGLGGANSTLTLPADALAGEYLLKDVPIVWDSDATQLVVTMPHGLYLSSSSVWPAKWYFKVPAGKAGTMYVSRPITLKLDGKDVALKPGAWNALRNDGAQDQTYEITPQGLSFVRFGGEIPAVLAPANPSRWFLPQAEVLPAPVPQTPPAAQVGFVPGASQKANDQALQLPGRGTLHIPVGDKLEEGVYQYLNQKRGTLELWFQPRWTSTLGTEPSLELPFIGGAFPMSVSYRNMLKDALSDREYARNFQVMAATAKGLPGGYPDQQLFNPVALEQGEWHHLAICWDTDPKRGWISEIYIDGKGSNMPDSPRRVGLGLRNWQEGDATSYRPFQLDTTKLRTDAIWILGQLNAAVDDIRISDVVRYPKPFTPPQNRSLSADDDTLLLLKLNGDTKAIAPRTNSTIDAAVDK